MIIQVCPIDKTRYQFTEEHRQYGNYATCCPKCRRSLGSQALETRIEEIIKTGEFHEEKLFLNGNEFCSTRYWVLGNERVDEDKNGITYFRNNNEAI